MTGKKRIWISERIKLLGKKKKDLADTLGLPHTRISEMISGTRALKITEIVNFADLMEMSVSEVLSGFNNSHLRPEENESGSRNYQLLENDEKDVLTLYRELSEPEKQKFQHLVSTVKNDDEK
ncbi:MAG TPA: helix-turn-helix domain-containing protein [Emcibacteraceae bacterium]|nr:helix-turn-helix domain-containing protein [Emcibacteraceae bacterium]